MTNPMDSDDRWYDAARRADDAILLRTTRFRTMKPGILAWAIVPLALAIVVGYGVAFWPLIAGGAAADVLLVASALVRWLFRVISGAVLLYAVINLVCRSIVMKPWNLVIGALNVSEKRDVRRQISGEDPLDQEKLPLVVVMAKQRHRMIEGFTPLYAGLFFLTISWALVTDSLELKLVSVAISAVLVVVGLWWLVAFRRTDAFVSTHAHVEYVPTRAHTLAMEALYPDPLAEDAVDDEGSATRTL